MRESDPTVRVAVAPGGAGLDHTGRLFRSDAPKFAASKAETPGPRRPRAHPTARATTPTTIVTAAASRLPDRPSDNTCVPISVAKRMLTSLAGAT